MLNGKAVACYAVSRLIQRMKWNVFLYITLVLCVGGWSDDACFIFSMW